MSPLDWSYPLCKVVLASRPFCDLKLIRFVLAAEEFASKSLLSTWIGWCPLTLVTNFRELPRLEQTYKCIYRLPLTCALHFDTLVCTLRFNLRLIVNAQNDAAGLQYAALASLACSRFSFKLRFDGSRDTFQLCQQPWAYLRYSTSIHGLFPGCGSFRWVTWGVCPAKHHR